MNLMSIAYTLIIGFLLGVFFFGGLWLTVRRVADSRHPALLVLGSFWGRSLVVLAGFYIVMDGQWQRVLACTAGFLVARLLISRGPVRHAP